MEDAWSHRPSIEGYHFDVMKALRSQQLLKFLDPELVHIDHNCPGHPFLRIPTALSDEPVTFSLDRIDLQLQDQEVINQDVWCAVRCFRTAKDAPWLALFIVVFSLVVQLLFIVEPILFVDLVELIQPALKIFSEIVGVFVL